MILRASRLILVVFLGAPLFPAAAADQSSSKPASVLAKDIHYLFQGAGGQEFRIAIASDGQITLDTIGSTGAPPERASGQLTTKQAVTLGRLLDGWERLADSYAARGARREIITYGDKTVAAGPESDAPAQFKEVAREIGWIAARQTIPETRIPMAGRNDLLIESTCVNSAQGETIARVWLVNKSPRPVRVYIPGFVGPVIRPPGPNPHSTLSEVRVGARFGPGDIVSLRPNEGVTREISMPHKNGIGVSGYYIVYVEGQEGKSDKILGVLYPEGRWVPAQ